MAVAGLIKLKKAMEEMTEEQKILNEQAFNNACAYRSAVQTDYAMASKWLNPNVVLPENYNEIMNEKAKKRELEGKKAEKFVENMTNLLQNYQFDEAFDLYAKQIAINEPNNENYINKDVLKYFLPRIYGNYTYLKDENKNANKRIIEWILEKIPEIVPKYAFDSACQGQNVELAKLFVAHDPNKYKLRIEQQQIDKIVYAEMDNKVIPLDNDDNED